MKVPSPFISPRCRAGIMLLAVSLLGACAVPASTSAPTPTIRAVATPQRLPELTEAAEVWHWLSSYGDQVWPGWGTIRIPLLIRAGEFDLLVGHPSPPPGFSPLPDTTAADQLVYRYAGHLVPVPAATAWEVGGVWSVAVPTRAEFQPLEKTWLDFHVALSDPASSPDGFRGRYFPLGAGQAFLLDRLRPDWKAQVFRDKQSLEDLLEQATR